MLQKKKYLHNNGFFDRGRKKESTFRCKNHEGIYNPHSAHSLF